MLGKVPIPELGRQQQSAAQVPLHVRRLREFPRECPVPTKRNRAPEIMQEIRVLPGVFGRVQRAQHERVLGAGVQHFPALERNALNALENSFDRVIDRELPLHDLPVQLHNVVASGQKSLLVMVVKEGPALRRCQVEFRLVAERLQDFYCFVQLSRSQKQIEVVKAALREVAVEEVRLERALPGD